MVVSPQHELRKRPVSMVNVAATAAPEETQPQVSEKVPGSPKYPRRHTVHDIKLEHGNMSKKEWRHLQRALSPQLSNEDGTPKTNKKQKKMQRKKDRDDKTDLLQMNTSSTASGVSCAASMGSSIDIPYRHVTESLNPSLYRRGSDNETVGSGSLHSRLRRTNSITLGLGDGEKERRCPPERKQFYRQFMKSIKFYGISSTAGNRMETPAPSHLPRFHSENLAASNPYSPLMDKLWLELQAYLRDKTPEQHEEWVFFNQAPVDQVLSRILNFSCSSVDSTQSMNVSVASASNSREGYEPLHGSHSSPNMSSLRRLESLKKGPLLEVHSHRMGVVRTEAACGGTDAPSPQGCGGVGGGEEGNGGAQQNLGPTRARTSSDADELTMCKVEHRNFLTALQRKALGEVESILSELDEVESYFMNRKKMGDEHPKYRTIYLKRRVCALTLWHKVTHGLAENLCRLSNWLGTAVLLPEICSDSHHLVVEGGVLAGHSEETPQPSLSSLASIETLKISKNPSYATLDGGGGGSDGSPVLPRSPLTKGIRPQFSVGSPGSDSEMAASLMKLRMQTQFSVARTESSSGQSASTLQRLFSQESRHDPYREFVSRALKRKGIAFTMKVNTELYPLNYRKEILLGLYVAEVG